MWLASMSRMDLRGEIISTGNWCMGKVEFYDNLVPAREVIREVLEGVGDRTREVLFRMDVALCLHRGVTEAEALSLPREWHVAGSGMAGPPVEILEQIGVKRPLSAMPCANPLHKIVMPRRPDLWVPVDCGRCASCLERIRIEKESSCLSNP